MTSSALPENKAQSFEVVVSDKDTALEQLITATGLTALQVTESMHKGALWHSALVVKKKSYRNPQRLRQLDGVVAQGDKLLLNYNAEVLTRCVDAPVLISDQVNYSFWYKPSGVFSQGTRWGDHCSMPYLVETAHQKPAYLVHRLDRAASGVMVLAHTKNAVKKLTAMFEARQVEKTYQAGIAGEIKEALPFEIKSPIDGKSAQTTVLAAQPQGNNQQVLTLQIDTGRKHQIRSHLASMGHPVIGDRLFDPDKSHQQNLQLVAVKIGLRCPFTAIYVEVQLPDKYQLQSSKIFQPTRSGEQHGS